MKVELLKNAVRDNRQALEYRLSTGELMDGLVLKQCKEGSVSGALQMGAVYEDGHNYMFAYIDRKQPLAACIGDVVTQELLLTVFESITRSLIQWKEQEINLAYAVLDSRYIYMDEACKKAWLICMPLKTTAAGEHVVADFFRTILAHAVYLNSDDGNYVAKLLSALNREFELQSFLRCIHGLMMDAGIEIPEETSEEAAAPEPTTVPVAEPEAVEQTVVEPEIATPEPTTVSIAEPEAVEQTVVEPEIATPEPTTVPVAEPEAVEQTVVEPEIATPEPTTVPVAEPEAVEQTVLEPEIATPEPTTVSIAEPEAVEQTVVEPEIATPEPTTVPVAEPEAVEQTVVEPEIATPEPTTVPVAEPEAVEQTVSQPQIVSVIEEEEIEFEPMPEALNAKIRRMTTQTAPSQDVSPSVTQQMPQTPPNIMPQTPPNVMPQAQQAVNHAQPTVMPQPQIMPQDVGLEPMPDPIHNQGPQTVPHPHLIRVKTGESISLPEGNFVIGKSQTGVNYTIADNNAISRIHCTIIKKNGVYYVRDEQSTNCTYVNGEQVLPNTEKLLLNNCRLVLGNEEFIYSLW